MAGGGPWDRRPTRSPRTWQNGGGGRWLGPMTRAARGACSVSPWATGGAAGRRGAAGRLLPRPAGRRGPGRAGAGPRRRQPTGAAPLRAGPLALRAEGRLAGQRCGAAAAGGLQCPASVPGHLPAGGHPRPGARPPGPMGPEPRAEKIVKWKVRALEAGFNGARRALAQAGGVGAKVTGLADGTALETTKRSTGWGQVTRTGRIEAPRGRGPAVTVYSWTVLLLIEAATQLPLAVQGVKLQAHAALWTRALPACTRWSLIRAVWLAPLGGGWRSPGCAWWCRPTPSWRRPGTPGPKPPPATDAAAAVGCTPCAMANAAWRGATGWSPRWGASRGCPPLTRMARRGPGPTLIVATSRPISSTPWSAARGTVAKRGLGATRLPDQCRNRPALAALGCG